MSTRLLLLVVTCLAAVSLSIFMWAVGSVPFDTWTFTLHVVSIYIGISLVLIVQDWHRIKHPGN